MSQPAAPAPVAGNVAPETPSTGGAPENKGTATPTTPKTPEPPKRFKLKVGDREEEIDETEVVRRAQIGTHATKRLQTAADIEKKHSALEEALKSPKALAKLAKERGWNREELRTEIEALYKSEFLDQDALTPEQKKLKEYEEKEAERLENDKKAAEAEKTRQKQLLVSHHKKQFAAGIKAALDELKIMAPELEHDEEMIRLAGREVYLNRKAGLPIDPKSIAAAVEKKLTAHHKAFYQNAPLETMVRVLGPDVLKRFLKLSIEWHKSQTAKPAPTPSLVEPTTDGAPKEKKSDYIKLNDWQKSRRSVG